MPLTSAPYLTPQEARSRVTPGSPPLDADTFSDEWVAQTVAECEELVEGECGVAFTPRETVETVQVSGGLHRLTLNWPKVRSIVSVTVDGDDLADDGWSIDKDAGIFTFTYPLACGVEAEITYQHGFDAPSPRLLKATGIFVERSAAGERSGSNRDVRYATETAVVYNSAKPGTWELTGWRDFDAIVAQLPHYRTPGIA